MPVNAADKPLDTLRDEAVDQLIMNYGHGRLSLEAFQRRLDDAFDARSHGRLLELTSDLDLQVDSGYVERKREEFDFHYAADEDLDVGEVEYLVNVFGGSDRTGVWTVPRELRVVAIFGGADVDLSEARFSNRTTRIRVFCLFGGVDIFVPEGVNTTVRAFSVFGGMSNKAPNTTHANAPRLVIDGLMIFGGSDVKVKKTFRERLMEFADGLRSFFDRPASPPRTP